MKKKIISMLLIGAMAISLCACGDSNNNSSSTAESSNPSSNEASQVQANTSSQSDDGLPKGDKDLIKSWGVGYSPRTEGADYYINTPLVGKDALNSSSIDYGYLVEEKASSGDFALDVDKIEDIRSTYEEMIFWRLEEAEDYSSGVKNQKMTVDSTENIKVNEYEICVTKGTYSCEVAGFSEENQYSAEYPYICYATLLTTGTPVFWVLIDKSEDKSMGAEMEEVAMNMAKTLREYDPDDEKSKTEAWGDASNGLKD